MITTGGGSPLFTDRADAGRVLAQSLEAYRGTGALVVGVPRGGVAVAAEVARQLGLPLDVVVARKLGAPWSPELAIGAVTSDGARYVNRRLISQLGVSDQYLEQITAAELREAERRERLFRAGAPAPSVTGRTVIVVDDGLATGATVRAACESLKRRQPGQLIVAAPVAAADTCAELRQVADAVVCPHELEDLGSVGYYYRRFEAVEDAEVQALLRSARVAEAGTPPH